MLNPAPTLRCRLLGHRWYVTMTRGFVGVMTCGRCPALANADRRPLEEAQRSYARQGHKVKIEERR